MFCRFCFCCLFLSYCMKWRCQRRTSQLAKTQKVHQTWSRIFVQDDQRSDDARHPSTEGKQEHNEHGPAPAVDDGERREKDGEDDAEEGHKEIICLDYSAKISVYGLNVNNRLRLWPVDSTRYLSLQRSLTMSLAALYEIPQI